MKIGNGVLSTGWPVVNWAPDQRPLIAPKRESGKSERRSRGKTQSPSPPSSSFLTQHSFEGPNHVYLGTKTFHNFQSIAPVLITRKIFKILGAQRARRTIKANHFRCLRFVC